jgi:hypothetical protein
MIETSFTNTLFVFLTLSDSVVAVEVVVRVDVLLDGGRGGVGPEELVVQVGLGLSDHVLDSLELYGLVDGIHEPRCLDEGSDYGRLKTDETMKGVLLILSLFLIARKYENIALL